MAEHGLEFYFKYDTGNKISLWASYVLAYNKDDIKDIVFEGRLNGKNGIFPRSCDQRHTVYFDFNYRPSKKWHCNFSWQYHTGWPYTGYHFESQARPDGTIAFYEVYGGFKGSRYPAYHRLDIRINRHFNTAHGRFTTFLQVINVYNRKNIQAIDVDVVENQSGKFDIVQDNEYWFGLMPALGISWDF